MYENILNIFSKIWSIGSVSATSESCREARTDSPRKDAGDILSPCTDTSKDSYSNSKPHNKYQCASSTDRGKTGAGVTGSRSCNRESVEDLLPSGATNPGLLRHLHNAARYRMPQCFEGASVSVRQGSNASNWILGHTWSFSSVSPSGYKCLLSYANTKKPTILPYFLMEGAPGGQISCEMRVRPTQSTRATVVAQVANTELYAFESIFDAYLKNSTASVIVVNKEFVALHYLQVTLYLILKYVFIT